MKKSKEWGTGTGENAAPACLYTYACHEDERELCLLELRTLLGCEPEDGWLRSGRVVDPGRSPFVKQRLDVLFEEASLPALLERLPELDLAGETFKAVYVEAGLRADYDGQRALERQAGARIRGRAEMRTPQRVLGLACADGRWLLGDLRRGEAHWLRHVQKPQNYSTALSTRVARAVVNLAVPEGAGRRLIDPCCGMGTVLVEALSMGIDSEGCDINPLAVRGARVNLRHFGWPESAVRLADMTELPGAYDAAVLDLPYNLCSKLSAEEQAGLLAGARRLAERAVIVATEEIAGEIAAAGFRIAGHAVLRKGAFRRQIYLCV
ncbi:MULTISPECIES: TRM11 family SAM-dependent methyltransferase [Paenibacillus]|uniref:TRM11 family SAM-dependent methyltransferase n=1 Tax=Paenibacillus TaxID=44249 RepID=UPI0022B8EFED|nr:RsmD family RNA methyltransferase [Paenibacillus caseinilyticus]MCZ8522282.1 RsmD family RNA methyltransferase [Paenibacillus caseinilyticus]